MEDLMGNFEGSVTQFFVPDFEVVVFFGFINKLQYPEAKEDDFYIMVCTNFIYDNGKPVEVFRISLEEPKYIYGSDRLPEDIKGAVIKVIMDNYKRGLEAINEYMGEDDYGIPHYDVNRPIPDYTKL